MNAYKKDFSRDYSNIDISRSRFDLSHEHITTLNEGDLIPIDLMEVLPGDTFQIKPGMMTRLQSTFVKAPIGNVFADIYYFFVPSRILFPDWKKLWGENKAYSADITTKVPTLNFDISPDLLSNLEKNKIKKFFNYFGLNIYNYGLFDGHTSPKLNSNLNALPIMAYQTIYNEWFRDQNLQDPIAVSSSLNGFTAGSNVITNKSSFMVQKVSKYHDYFTSCTLAPQKGPSVTTGLSGSADVVLGEPHSMVRGTINTLLFGNNDDRFSGIDTYTLAAQTVNSSSPDMKVGYNTTAPGTPENHDLNSIINRSNLVADLSTATAITINELRIAFQLQKFFEKLTNGSRYREILSSLYGVTIPDSTVQIPEYLGGKHIPLSISQVMQSSQTVENSPQGNIAGQSFTLDTNVDDIVFSSYEHGYILGLMTIRCEHLYAFGTSRLFNKVEYTDYYQPLFANLGNMPVYDTEIYDGGFEISMSNDQKGVFGYNEAWADYRFIPSRVSGDVSPLIDNSLDVWHFADNYIESPTLSLGWMLEGTENIDKTITVSSSIADQFIVDFYSETYATRPMPVVSIPGLIDHH